MMKILNETFKWGRLLVLAGAVSFSITSCNTDDDEPDPPANPAGSPPTPAIAEGYATLVAIESVTFQDIPVVGGQIQVDLGLAVGLFFNGVDYDTYLNAGTVTCEDENLAEQENGSYVYMPSQTSTTGIEFSGKPSWTVSGNGNIPGFSHTTSIGFPTVGAITSGGTASSGSAYTLTIASVTGADSVIFSMGGVLHTEVGSATSSVFTAAEVGTMGTGTTYAQAAAYKIEEATYSGKNFWFVNEKVVTQSITIE